MAKAPARPGSVIDLQPPGATLGKRHKARLVKTEDIEIIRLVIPAGERIPRYKAPGEVILHCLEGRLSVAAGGKVHELNTGQLLYLSALKTFSMRASENTLMLVTIALPKTGGRVELIGAGP